MQKTYCDLCGKEMNPSRVVFVGEKYATTEVIIHHEGRTLDICDECRKALVRYALEDMRDRAKKQQGLVDISRPIVSMKEDV